MRNVVPQSKIQVFKTTAQLPPTAGNACVPRHLDLLQQSSSDT